MRVKGNLFIPSKVRYVRGEKPNVDCILCAIREKDKKVESLEICRTSQFCICANLYPYNPGHIMIFPLRHIEDIREMKKKEAAELFTLEIISLEILDEVFKPHGYNIGYNLGPCGGNSIKHLHQHIVPRFSNELGFVDVITESRIIVDDPRFSLPKLKSLFAVKLKK